MIKNNIAYQNIAKNKLDITNRIKESNMEVLLKLQKEFMKHLEQDPSLSDNLRELYERVCKVFSSSHTPIKSKEDILVGDVKIRVYKNNEKKNNPCIIYLHGGGFHLGSIDTHDTIAASMCYHSDATVISVDYKLAPEHIYPAPILDIIAVTEHIRKDAKSFGIDHMRISYAGDSAGGFLSLGTYLYLRDKGEDVSYIKSLGLLYATIGLKDSRSRRLYGNLIDGLILENLENYEHMFFGENSELILPVDCNLSEKMPPIFILASDIDCLLDDSLLLYEILKEHNNPVELVMANGYTHDFLHYGDTIEDVNKFIKVCADYLIQD